jgi:competence ComEA-like helix-hairpin-helix protein
MTGPSMARGAAALFVLAALVVVGRAAAGWLPDPVRPRERACAAWVELAPSGVALCADDARLAACGPVPAAAQVQLMREGCTITPQGMRSSTRLVLGMPLDLNRASARELALIDGLGERLAETIVAHRQANGPFASVDELDRVRGIGPAKLAVLRPFVGVLP